MDAIMMNVLEVAEAMGVSKAYAYKVIQKLNKELQDKGYITVAGKVNRKYFMKKLEYQQELEGLTKDQQAVKTENRKLKEENREIKAEILSKKQIEAMPMPPKTLKGDFKVSPDQYRNLVATAKRVDMVLDKEKAISRKETKLREERTRLEAERKLPIKEQMELFKLRVLKNVVEKVTKILQEGWIKRVLSAALTGRDVMDQEQNKTMSVAERPANARRSDREVI
jgi:transposase